MGKVNSIIFSVHKIDLSYARKRNTKRGKKTTGNRRKKINKQLNFGNCSFVTRQAAFVNAIFRDRIVAAQLSTTRLSQTRAE